MDPVTALLMLAAVIVLAFIVIVLPLMMIKAIVGVPFKLARAASGKSRRRR